MAEKKRPGGEMTVREAGRKGGEKVASERGHAFYEEIGKKGGEKVASERGHAFYEEIGHKGGQKVRELIARGKGEASPGASAVHPKPDEEEPAPSAAKSDDSDD